MTAYYNEIDPYAAQWLRNLIAEGHIAPGEVDERSIIDVSPDDLAGYDQCHFFAGIGGWSLAARLAGWPDDRDLWTGSCPCQPFSTAGKRRGFADHRHLWPAWRDLIKFRRPSRVVGEQVASAPEWLRLVRGDLEAMDYAVAAIPIEAASAGSWQLRDRFWFVASSSKQHDGSSDATTCEGQKSELGSRLRPDGDRGREIRVAGRVLPDAIVSLLAHEIPHRLAQYRAFGNAIDPYVAAEVIAAFMDTQHPHNLDPES